MKTLIWIIIGVLAVIYVIGVNLRLAYETPLKDALLWPVNSLFGTSRGQLAPP